MFFFFFSGQGFSMLLTLCPFLYVGSSGKESNLCFVNRENNILKFLDLILFDSQFSQNSI